MVRQSEKLGKQEIREGGRYSRFFLLPGVQAAAYAPGHNTILCLSAIIGNERGVMKHSESFTGEMCVCESLMTVRGKRGAMVDRVGPRAKY